MAEHVLVVAPRLDKPITLLKIPPLHRALLPCGSAILCFFCKGPLKQVAYFKGSPDLSAIGRTKENSETRHARRKPKGLKGVCLFPIEEKVVFYCCCIVEPTRWCGLIIFARANPPQIFINFSFLFLWHFTISWEVLKKILAAGRTLCRLKWKARQWRNSL